MKRGIVVLVVILTALASLGAGVGAWALARDRGEQQPEISVFSHGQLTRVGPYRYCNVLDLNDCQSPGTVGELPVTARNPVQLAVPAAIARAPWLLLEVYEDGVVSTVFPPNTRLAVTIPTVDAHRGRLDGVAVQLLTVVVFPDGELGPAPHAEWSVATVWPDSAPAG